MLLFRTSDVMERPEPIRAASSYENRSDLQNYRTVAEQVGFLPQTLLDMLLTDFLIEQQIPLYDNVAVHRYMKKIAKAAGQHYVWRPLRPVDKENMKNFMWRWDTAGAADGTYDPRESDCAPYDKLVPAYILEDVKTIEGEFGGKVAFFVTDYAVKDPDPFIMVTSPHISSKKFVFGAWDEPGFGHPAIKSVIG